ncbi:MAG: hypothetical protein E6K70_03065 [Planctomycetota bacterium]|nr:MAG: hypothetical protein E6K70_03065 [Planctomycetota bacterium]
MARNAGLCGLLACLILTAPPVWAQPDRPLPAQQQTPEPRGLFGRPLDEPPRPEVAVLPPAPEALLRLPSDPPLGYTGPSGITPSETQESSHFVPMEDRWRIGWPAWDRYDQGHPLAKDYPYDLGHWWDPYHQNVLKGDYPIIGQHTFLEVTAVNLSLFEVRQVPTATTPFESTTRPGRDEFFGSPNQFFYTNFLSLSLDLFHVDAAFKPVDWRIKVTPVFDVNYLAVDELAVVNPDVRRGTTRGRTWFSIEEYFVETKLADLSPDYDFLSLRVGSQPFTSDFRGFIFSDTNRAIRLFGTRLSNKEQFNIIAFDQQEKDTNSDLNTFQMRHQNVFIANYYRQDFIFPGYTAQFSVHYDHDRPTFHFDKNDFLVRPDPAGIFQPHMVDAVYFGWTGDGHIDRYNITHALYWVVGRDSLNPIAGDSQDINAQMAALELSYDRDWVRFRTSFFWASGDSNPNNKHATGFDTILDNPNFAGGGFSYWQRQAIKLFGVNLTNRMSLVPDLRASKTEGQANFVNPGLWLANAGIDFELTPKLRMINNCNFLWFDETESLKTFTFQGNIRDYIGVDLSTGFEYRPLLSNNAILTAGLSMLIPGGGFKDLYNRLTDSVNPMLAAFMQVELAY